MTNIDLLSGMVDSWLKHRKDVNVFYIRQRAKLENWSLEKYNEVLKYV